MKKDFVELVEYLDKKFGVLDQQFEVSDKRMDGFGDAFIAIDRRFLSVEHRLDVLGEKFNELQVAVDHYAKRADAYFQEMTMLSHQVNRHERWLEQIAEKVGVKLKH